MLKIIRNQKGSLLMTAVVLLLVLGIFSLAFAFWLAVQSKGGQRKRANARAQYYGEAGVQKAIDFIQFDTVWGQNKFLDTCTTDSFTMNVVIDNVPVTVSVWDLP